MIYRTLVFGVISQIANVAQSQSDLISPSLYGLYGTIDTPTAYVSPDAELRFTSSHFGGSTRSTLMFQVLPQVTGAFRYSRIVNHDPNQQDLYDRSFDLKYQFFDEAPGRPAFAFGLQDFIGTGDFSAEYFVVSKSIASQISVSVGMGWGRLGSYNGHANPLGGISQYFATRPIFVGGANNSQTGQIEASSWFRGDVGLFGGVLWKPQDRLMFKLEYSSDAYTRETEQGNFTHKSPINLGVEYDFGVGAQLAAYWMHGSEVGVSLSFALNPKEPATLTRDGAPLPVALRAPQSAENLGWATANKDGVFEAMATPLAEIFAQDGILLHGIDLQATQATIRIENTKYAAQSQAIGRVARVLTHILPASIETIDIIPMARGLAGAKIRLSRSALEQFEGAPDGAQQLLSTVQFLDAADAPRSMGAIARQTPEFTWSFGPYAELSLFDPDDPVRYDVGVELSGEWNPVSGLYLAGSVRKRAFGTIDQSTRASDSVLPHVRSDANLYDKEGDPSLEYLTAAYFFRPGKNLYGRVTAGYLEAMYGGVSTEILWKPVDSRLAIGAELNYVKQRSFDMRLGFDPLTVDPSTETLQPLSTYPVKSYEVATGHLSAYYAFAQGFHGQLDIGRYLAGDWGATVSLDREFNNGWRVGAYATLTDVPFETFGEGSFDKGIYMEIPIDWQIGSPSRDANNIVLKPLTRDGGARVKVQDRLYGLVRDTHRPDLEDRWGRFWR